MSLNVEAPETAEEKVVPIPGGSVARDMKLPQGLEEVLAFKSKWASQQGHQPSDIARVEREGVVFQPEQNPQAEVGIFFMAFRGKSLLESCGSTFLPD